MHEGYVRIWKEMEGSDILASIWRKPGSTFHNFKRYHFCGACLFCDYSIHQQHINTFIVLFCEYASVTLNHHQ